MIPLTVPEVRRLLFQLVLLRLPDPEEVIQWSQWRRHHQATAQRHHYATRGHPPK